MSCFGLKLQKWLNKHLSFFSTGESGAVTLGALYRICGKGNNSEIKEQLGLDENSRILLISTEGDTDPEGFQRIIHS